VVALNPKTKEAFASHHAVVGLLILVKLLHVFYEGLDVAAAASDYDVYHVETHDQSDRQACGDVDIVADHRRDEPAQKDQVCYHHGDVPGCTNFGGIIGPVQDGVSHVEEHVSKAVGEALVASREGSVVGGISRWIALGLIVGVGLEGLVVGVGLKGSLGLMSDSAVKLHLTHFCYHGNPQ
jgi:hypothetical protein